MSSRVGSQRARGFTLVEVVISVAILVVLATIGYGAMRQILITKNLLDDERDVALIQNAVLNRLTRELQLAVALESSPLLPDRDQLSKKNPARLAMKSTSDQLSNGNAGDSLTFLALEGGQYLPDGGGHTGLVQITYRVAEDPDNPNPSEGPYLLIREETPYLRPAERAYKKSMIFPVCKNLQALRLRFFDADEDAWTSTWGSESRQGLPALIKFSLQFSSPSGRLSTISTEVALRQSD
jgi:type II secretion system protein J